MDDPDTTLTLHPLDLVRFGDFETLTGCGDDGEICYCSFWHVKVGSFAEYEAMKADPAGIRELIRSKVRAGFHVGALAYEAGELVAWVSVGPLPETYWCWRRVAALGADLAASTAAITCVTLAAGRRGQGLQRRLAAALKDYGRARGWRAIEAYPYDDQTIAGSTRPLAWPGYAAPYTAAGYTRVAPHWLSQPGNERWIHRAEL